MNIQEGMRRFALLLSILGAVAGLFLGYNKVQIMWCAHVQHEKFASFVNNPEVQRAAREAMENWRDRQRDRPWLDDRWENNSVNDPERKVVGIEVDTRTEKIAAVYLVGEQVVCDDTDRPFYAYLAIIVYPMIGFVIPWVGVRSIAWVMAGFSKQK
jgi:hypothetical protein